MRYFNKLIYLFLPALTFFYVLFNLFIIKTGSSLCHSNGCEATKTILSVDNIYLYYLGLFGSFSLFLAGIIFIKKNISLFFNIILFSMFLAETIFLSYLYLKTNEMCILCFIFYSFLIINLFLLSIKEKIYFLNPLIYICVVLFAMNLLDIKNQPNALTNKYTIIGSKDCVHCIKTKDTLKSLNINFKEENYRNYTQLFKAFNISSIPVLVINDGETIKTISGESNIIELFMPTENNIPNNFIESIETKQNSEFSSKMYLEPLPPLSKQDGCNINLLYEETCGK